MKKALPFFLFSVVYLISNAEAGDGLAERIKAQKQQQGAYQQQVLQQRAVQQQQQVVQQTAVQQQAALRQDMLAQESESVLSLLNDPKTCLYIVGSPDMASTVQNRYCHLHACVQIVQAWPFQSNFCIFKCKI